jgi:hypothetical protein
VVVVLVQQDILLVKLVVQVVAVQIELIKAVVQPIKGLLVV